MFLKNGLMKFLLLGCIILLAFIGYLFISSPSNYIINTSFQENLISVGKDNTLLTKNPNNNNDFCAPPGCGPDQSTPTEDIKLELTGKQLTAMLNVLKPKSFPVSNIKIKIDSGQIFLNAISYYPLIPGNITVVADLKLNHFYVKEVYIGNIKAPRKIASFIEANGASLLDKTFQNNNVYLKRMQLEENKFVFEATVPNGMVEVDDQIIKINLSTHKDLQQTDIIN